MASLILYVTSNLRSQAWILATNLTIGGLLLLSPWLITEIMVELMMLVGVAKERGRIGRNERVTG